MSAIKMKAVVRRQEQLAGEIYSLSVYAPEVSKEAKPGQFVSLKTGRNYCLVQSASAR